MRRKRSTTVQYTYKVMREMDPVQFQSLWLPEDCVREGGKVLDYTLDVRTRVRRRGINSFSTLRAAARYQQHVQYPTVIVWGEIPENTLVWKDSQGILCVSEYWIPRAKVESVWWNGVAYGYLKWTGQEHECQWASYAISLRNRESTGYMLDADIDSRLGLNAAGCLCIIKTAALTEEEMGQQVGRTYWKVFADPAQDKPSGNGTMTSVIPLRNRIALGFWKPGNLGSIYNYYPQQRTTCNGNGIFAYTNFLGAERMFRLLNDSSGVRPISLWECEGDPSPHIDGNSTCRVRYLTPTRCIHKSYV